MEVVVALAAPDVASQPLRQVPLVLVHEVHHVVPHQRGEPADPVPTVGEVPDVRRCRGHDAHGGGVAAGLPRGRPDLVDEPADQVGVGDLEHGAVGDPAGQLEGDRAVPGDPDRQPVWTRPRQLQRCTLVLDRPSLGEGTNHVDRLLERGHARGRLAQHPACGIATPDPQVEAAPGQLLEHRQGRGGHRRLPGRRVRHARAQAERRGRLRHQGQEDVWLAPEDVGVEEPGVGEAGRLALPGQRQGPLDRVLGLEREPELHAAPPPTGSPVATGGPGLRRLRDGGPGRTATSGAPP